MINALSSAISDMRTQNFFYRGSGLTRNLTFNVSIYCFIFALTAFLRCGAELSIRHFTSSLVMTFTAVYFACNWSRGRGAMLTHVAMKYPAEQGTSVDFVWLQYCAGEMTYTLKDSALDMGDSDVMTMAHIFVKKLLLNINIFQNLLNPSTPRSAQNISWLFWYQIYRNWIKNNRVLIIITKTGSFWKKCKISNSIDHNIIKPHGYSRLYKYRPG